MWIIVLCIVIIVLSCIVSCVWMIYNLSKNVDANAIIDISNTTNDIILQIDNVMSPKSSA